MTLRIGVAGLGAIAQKAWLPVISQAHGWQLIGAFSPSQQKAQEICRTWRMKHYARLDLLAADCDALFVHSSTDSHFSVVRELLLAGKDVFVDKPLAATLSEAEQLVELAHRRGRRLMVGFNRRFAPRYQQLKPWMAHAVSLRVDKHRTDSVGPGDLRFTLLDDYLHVVDTALWLCGGRAQRLHGQIQTNESGEMLYAGHHFSANGMTLSTSMHRRAGTQRETVSALCDGTLIRINEMRDWRQEQNGQLLTEPVSGWQDLLIQRGFYGAAHHFIQCVQNQTQPETSGEQALMALRVVEKLWRDAESE